MTNKSAELSQGNGGASLPSPRFQSQSQPQPQPQPQTGIPDHLRSQSGNSNMTTNLRSQSGKSNTIYKSGPLFISSKGIGWTSWKKRWFILTQNSLVFFRSDPSAVPQKGGEVNLTLGGIDLNNSGSVVVKADKKLLTVQFPDVRDGRAFTLKAETTEDLYEWKAALENALAHAPSAANVMGQNGIFRNDQTDSIDIDIPLDHVKEREPMNTVIGRPILLALEDVDGTPSFLEKALRFIEEHGYKTEGILRQAADVDDVEHRMREYEQGKVEFSAEEDAHVVGDCIKYVLRELPSSPVPASCCKALLEACRKTVGTDRASRISAMRAAICDTFPEPNRRLLQRILMMMQTVASGKALNRMSSSAVAACMAPLLLRPLLAGDCEIEHDFDVGGDGSVQLLQAAAAANHAQAICITLLEEYNSIFGEGSASPGPDLYSDSEESGSESEEGSDDDLSYDDYSDDEEDESIHESDVDEDDDVVSESYSESGDSRASDVSDDKDHDLSSSSSKSSGVSEEDVEVNQMLSSKDSKSLEISLPPHEDSKSCEKVVSPVKTSSVDESNEPASVDEFNKPADVVGSVSTDQTTLHDSNCPTSSCMKKSITISNCPAPRRRTILGRTSARKNLSMESIDFNEYAEEDEDEIERHEAVKTDLQNQISEEVKANATLQSDLEKHKKSLVERRLALQRDVARLKERLHKEKSSRATLEAGLKVSPGPLSDLSCIDEKTKADLEELVLIEVDLTNLEQKADELGMRLNVQLERNWGSKLDSCDQPRQISNQEIKVKNKPDAEVAATSQSQSHRSINKDVHYDESETENERKPKSKPLPNKHLRSSSKKAGTRGEDINFGESESENERKPESKRLPSKHLRTSSKKSGSKGEGGNFALTKLTSKLNFMKDRRSPNPNEPQNMDKGRDLSHSAHNLEKGKVSELHQPPLSPNTKSRGPEIHYVPNPEKGRGLDTCHSLQVSDKGSRKEGRSVQNSDKLKKSDSQPGSQLDKQNQHPQYLKRGRSESHHKSSNVDKGQ